MGAKTADQITLIDIVLSPETAPDFETLLNSFDLPTLIKSCQELEAWRARQHDLYSRVRACALLAGIGRFRLQDDSTLPHGQAVPTAAWQARLNRRFAEACAILWQSIAEHGPGRMLLAELSATYHAWQYAELAEQVRSSVRNSKGNRWLFRCGSLQEYPLRLNRRLIHPDPSSRIFPILREATPVRLDLTHSGWSDIFFLAMECPHLARVINCSVDLVVGEAGKAPPQAVRSPICCSLRVITEPCIRLTATDLGETNDYHELSDIFDFAADHLGLLKAAVVASGIVPPACDATGQSLAHLLGVLIGPGYGLELVSEVQGIPKGSRLAVSTNLLGSMISLLMRATGQTKDLMNGLEEDERRIVASRAILGEWLGGSGGGWQDSGGIWPGIKAIEGQTAVAGDPEMGISQGCLLPRHRAIHLSPEARQRIEQSLLVFHGGMSGNVGPILEQVTTQHLLGWTKARAARDELVATFPLIEEAMIAGDTKLLGSLTQKIFDGPLRSIIPGVDNAFTQACIAAARQHFGSDFWGFCMLGGMSGGGMAMWVNPAARATVEAAWPAILVEISNAFQHSMPFVITPVACRIAINERGTWSSLQQDKQALMSAAYYRIHASIMARTRHEDLNPLRRADLLRHIDHPEGAGDQQQQLLQSLVANLIPGAVTGTGGYNAATVAHTLNDFGHNQDWQNHLLARMRSGRISLRANRLPPTAALHDVASENVQQQPDAHCLDQARSDIAAGRYATLTLAGGLGSRWSGGSGVIKALAHVANYNGAWRSFLELQLRKFAVCDGQQQKSGLHIVSTSFLTHAPITAALHNWSASKQQWAQHCQISSGRNLLQRMIPTQNDLHTWLEKLPRPRLHPQAEKARADRDRAWLQWAEQQGAAQPYTDNVLAQVLNPPGHWWEIPNLLLNGTLHQLLQERNDLQWLLVHNIDTLGVTPDAQHLARHISTKSALSFEVIERLSGDSGGSLAMVNNKMRLIEGLAIPHEAIELSLAYYNSNTCWVGIDALLQIFGLNRDELANSERVATAVHAMAKRLPVYVTIKEAKRRWGRGQEDTFPIAQCEQLWGDMTTLDDVPCSFLHVDRRRGQQLKDVAQLPDWHQDGSANDTAALSP